MSEEAEPKTVEAPDPFQKHTMEWTTGDKFIVNDNYAFLDNKGLPIPPGELAIENLALVGKIGTIEGFAFQENLEMDMEFGIEVPLDAIMIVGRINDFDYEALKQELIEYDSEAAEAIGDRLPFHYFTLLEISHYDE